MIITSMGYYKRGFSPTIEVTVSNKNLLDGISVICTNGTKNISGTWAGDTVVRFYPDELGTWTIKSVFNDNLATNQVSTIVSGVQVYSVAINVIPAFSTASWENISNLAPYASTIVNNSLWNIGDFNSNATYGGYSGVYLVHVLDDTQRVTYNTTGHIVVQFRDLIAASQWHSDASSQTSYSVSTLFSNLNGTIYNGLNSDFKAVLKQFGPPTSVQNDSSTVIELEYPVGYLHEPNCVEVGSTNSYRPSENSVSFELQWYKNGNSKIKSGAGSYWWLRSPAGHSTILKKFYSYFITDSGEVTYGTISETYGVAPIGCI